VQTGSTVPALPDMPPRGLERLAETELGLAPVAILLVRDGYPQDSYLHRAISRHSVTMKNH
jgi:hypothetical protein